MELLWLFGMSTKAYAWFILISSGIFAIIITVGANFSDKDFYNFFHPTINLPDEIIIKIEKKSPDQASASQNEPSALPETISENLSASDTNHPTEKVSSEESSV